RRLRAALLRLSRGRPVLFPVHPRARKRLAAAGWPLDGPGDLRLIDPVGYVEMLGLVAGAALVITDSGGLQEETTYLGVPCLTVRPNTERPITATNGTNRLVPPRGAAPAPPPPRRLPTPSFLPPPAARPTPRERDCMGAASPRPRHNRPSLGGIAESPLRHPGTALA